MSRSSCSTMSSLPPFPHAVMLALDPQRSRQTLAKWLIAVVFLPFTLAFAHTPARVKTPSNFDHGIRKTHQNNTRRHATPHRCKHTSVASVARRRFPPCRRGLMAPIPVPATPPATGASRGLRSQPLRVGSVHTKIPAETEVLFPRLPVNDNKRTQRRRYLPIHERVGLDARGAHLVEQT